MLITHYLTSGSMYSYCDGCRVSGKLLKIASLVTHTTGAKYLQDKNRISCSVYDQRIPQTVQFNIKVSVVAGLGNQLSLQLTVVLNDSAAASLNNTSICPSQHG